ncbi:hypothetical protein IMSHALPRED_008308 [Imshaugia aleurites]|uniref:Uncharacterized protein n=1 Tax=Imshaugia aleurites TaxID=172621 RepID=A0A8H3IT43_9LECA|nr:hypothetical protein IMSHALPRED_008308 [Imshaugia aleurites]
MKSILAATLLATTALATPFSLHPVPETTNVTIHTRQDAPGDGVDSGISITIYPKSNCKGTAIPKQSLYYNAQIPQQLRSYSLSDDLGPDDVMTFWTNIGNDVTSTQVDTSMSGNDLACAQYVYNAEGNDVKQGCHTLPDVVGCVTIMLNQSTVVG